MPLRKSSNESVLLDGESVDCRMENGCLCFRVPPSLHEARAELCARIKRTAHPHDSIAAEPTFSVPRLFYDNQMGVI